MIESVAHTTVKCVRAFFTCVMVIGMAIAVLGHAGPFHVGLFLTRGGSQGSVQDATTRLEMTKNDKQHRHDFPPMSTVDKELFVYRQDRQFEVLF